jgi:arsenate reductase (thioredoxin)
MNQDKQRLLFLCSGNSCRSQMAEGFARSLHADSISTFSAGINTGKLDPLAVEVMQEVGIDISRQESSSVMEVIEESFDLVITVCSEADQNCPTLPEVSRHLHQPFDDPPALVASNQLHSDKLEIYRRVRDEIGEFCKTLPEVFDNI